MKVRVPIVLDIDKAEYEAEYGERFTPLDIRLHLESLVTDAVREAVRHLPIEVHRA